MPIKKAKKTKGKCDILYSKIIRSLGYCQKCYQKPPGVQLQTAHIMSRKFSATRCDRNNAFCLCAGCHRYFTDHPVEFAKFVESEIGKEKYEELYQKAHTPTKINWELVYEGLKEIAKKLDIT